MKKNIKKKIKNKKKILLVLQGPQKSLKQVISYTFGELAHFLKA
jgi:hypothetical protein